MHRFIWAHLRGRAGRTLALLAGLLITTTGFVVLSGTSATSQLEVTGTVRTGTRAAYDILVRPAGSRSAIEADDGLVRPNYLSGLFGGLTLAQLAAVRDVPGVRVAAPIGMIGYTPVAMEARLDLTDAVDRAATQQVIRVDPTFLAERGLSRADGRPIYMYVTRNPLTYPQIVEIPNNGGVEFRYANGATVATDTCANDLPPVLETMPDGHVEPVCTIIPMVAGGRTVSDLDFTDIYTAELRPDGRFIVRTLPIGGHIPDTPTDRLVLRVRWHVPFLLAAIDPDAENDLVGIAGAVVDGRALRSDDRALDVARTRVHQVLASSRAYADAIVTARYTRLRPDRVAGAPSQNLAAMLAATPGTAAGTGRDDVAANHRDAMRAMIAAAPGAVGILESVVQAGPTAYERLPDGTLRAQAFQSKPDIFGAHRFISLPEPWMTADPWFRPLTRLDLATESDPPPYHGWKPVGTFDPEKLTGFSDLSRLPLETYEPPRAVGADDASRQALGDRPLLPGGNPGGYLSSPPLMLMNLAAVPDLYNHVAPARAAAPISAVRVRVAGVDGYSKKAAERVRLTAEEIAARTGLDVDITFGSSPTPRTVELAAGDFGRPTLRLSEGWSLLGVASRIVQATDRKSLLLFVLVLVVCALFLANAVAAAVRDRRTELAVLACLGWPGSRIIGVLLGEVAVLGLAAGVASVVLSAPIAALTGVRITIGHAALAVPIALVLALAAAAWPAVRATRGHPASALRPAVVRRRRKRSRGVRSVAGLSAVNLVRTPGRTVLGAGALAIGVCALTMLAAVLFAFRGAVIGTVLGDAVALTVRGVDLLAAATTVLLGAVAVADVLYLNVRDRAGELAALRASGWTDGALGRLVAGEGLGIGLLGGAAGAAAGLGGAAWFVGDVSTRLVTTAATTGALGTLAAVIAAIVPATMLRRLPTARLLAEE